MSQLAIHYDSAISRKKINRIVEEALDREKKIIEHALKRTQEKLRKFELQYNMSSSEFFQQYQAGKTDDRDDFIDWAGEYQILMSINDRMNDIKELRIEYN
ncbi:MAG: hypothetical protein ONB27_12985 [candidate division KSB1 bacterium]|nr:hypothetical protein [candidate division KSB1 bacterium]